MSEKLTSKRKIALLVITTLILSWVSYQFSFSKTFEEILIYRQYIDQGIRQSNRAREQSQINVEHDKINYLFELYKLDTTRVEKNLLNSVSRYCKDNHINLVQYQMRPIEKNDPFFTVTRVLSAESNFRKLLGFVYMIETKPGLGKVKSVSFTVAPESASTKAKLICRIYIQNFTHAK